MENKEKNRFLTNEQSVDETMSRIKSNNAFYDKVEKKKSMKAKNKFIQKQFTEADLISFGQYLVSKERLEKIKEFEKDDNVAMEVFHSVTDAAFQNWIQGKKSYNMEDA